MRLPGKTSRKPLAEATGVDMQLSRKWVSKTLAGLFRGLRPRPDHGPVSGRTGAVPVVRRKLPPQQQQAQESGEAQHQEQSGHQRNPGYGDEKSQTSVTPAGAPPPGPPHAALVPPLVDLGAARAPPTAQLQTAFALAGPSPVSEAVSTRTGADQALQGPW